MHGYYDFGYTQPVYGDAAGVAGGVLLGFMMLFYLIAISFGVVSYVFTSLSVYTIAKRRGIHHPWLAWVPVGSVWLWGCISDQYQQFAKGKIRNRRKVLLGLAIGFMAAFFLLFACAFSVAIAEAMGAGAAIGLWLFAMLLLYFAMLAMAVVLAVFEYIALYDLFSSCDPDNAVLFLVLTIFFSVTLPFFLFACRKKDRGMPISFEQKSAESEQQPATPEQTQM